MDPRASTGANPALRALLALPLAAACASNTPSAELSREVPVFATRASAVDTVSFHDRELHMTLAAGWEQVERPPNAVSPLRAVFEKEGARMMLMCFDSKKGGASGVHGISVSMVRALVQGATRVAGPVSIPGDGSQPILEAYEGEASIDGQTMRTTLLIASKAPTGGPQCSLIMASPADDADQLARDLVSMAQSLGI